MVTARTAFLCLLLIASVFIQLVAAEKPDEYGDVCWKREKEILRYLAVRLQNEPEARGYLLYYAGRRTPSLDVARMRGQRAKEYLVKLGIGPERVVAVDGGFREDFTWETWVVPPGANPPTASPTVERGEVRTVAESAKKPCPESERGRN